MFLELFYPVTVGLGLALAIPCVIARSIIPLFSNKKLLINHFLIIICVIIIFLESSRFQHPSAHRTTHLPGLALSLSIRCALFRANQAIQTTVRTHTQRQISSWTASNEFRAQLGHQEPSSQLIAK